MAGRQMSRGFAGRAGACWAVLALVVAVVVPERASGWGGPGHRVIAAVAEARLTPAARAMVRELVGDVPLSDAAIATWADAQRDPRTRPWHYVNIPLGRSYDAARDCPRGCAVEAVLRAVRELEGDGPPLRRADALRWVVHVVGDLHQPLHAGDGWDRGGNGFQVRVGRRREPTTFHHVWDSEVLAGVARGRPDTTARGLLATLGACDSAGHGDAIDPAAWAGEASREAQRLYVELGRRPQDRAIVTLPADYVTRHEAYAERRLLVAGCRLAALLDAVARERVRGGR